MSIYISKKMSGMKPSAIREFFKYAADPQVISMAAGNPAPDSLPVKAISRLTAQIMEQEIDAALRYSISEGHTPLRESLKAYLGGQDAYDSDRDEVIVFSGSQQCMDIACRVLCDPGDTIICEDPSFIGSVNAFRSWGVNVVGVPMQEDGIDIEKLERALKTEQKVRFLYLIPNFQNPTGYTMSAQKRAECYRLAKQYGVLILEDDPYGDLRFSGEHILPIKCLDKDGIVLYARSFSKTLAPGLRVGYLCFPKEMAGPVTVAKQCADVHTSVLAQLICNKFLTEEDMAAHLREVASVYRRKCGELLAELDKLPAEKISFSRPQGGMFIWATFKDGRDAGEFCMRLVQEKKVAVVPGSAFLAQPGPSPYFRMTFATPTQEQMVKGIAAIGEML
ncbi:MAG: PLP-dependent aminotransferase family protein [Oscillospiraceae bacterium]|nr:PLP-dependent aminotransferase family protein [Oscillospiraceae bacterium]